MAGINNYESEQQREVQQAEQPTVFDMLGQAAQSDPKLAYMLGPYGSQYDGGRDAEMPVSETGDINYSGEPLPGHPATYVDYLVSPGDSMEGGGGINVTRPAFATNRANGAADQMGYDAQWMAYAHGMQQQQSGISDPASVQAAQDAYNAAASSDTVANGGQYDPEKVQELNDALDAMIEQNGWSFGSSQDVADQITTLPAITVTGTAVTDSSNGLYGLLSYAAAGSGTGESDTADDFATGFSLIGTAADAGNLASKSLGKPWGISIDWTNPLGYDDVLTNNGGKLPSWLAGPEIKNINIGTDAGALRDADYVVDLSKLSKLTPWLEGAGVVLGGAGVGLEAWDAFNSNDGGKKLHAIVDAAVFGGSVAAPYLLPEAIGGPVGLAIGLGWLALDTAMSHYTYQGQQGWGAAAKEYGDTVNRVRQANPGFMTEKW